MESPRDVPVLFGTVSPTLPAMADQGKLGQFRPPNEERISQLTKKVMILNYSTKDLVVVDRSGIKITTKHVPDFRNTSNIIIRQEFKISYKNREEITRLFVNVTDEINNTLAVIKTIFERNVETRLNGDIIVSVDHTLNIRDIQSRGGTIYHHETDLLISSNTFDNTPNHPYALFSGERVTVNNYDEIENGFKLDIQLIDNDGVFGPRFLNFNNEIFKISPVKDENKQSGVYVVSTFPITADNDSTFQKSSFYKFEDCQSKLNLFKTFEEAKSLGDLSAINKENEDKRKKELAEFEHTISRQKAENEAETLRLKGEFSRLEASRNQLKHDADVILLEKENKSKEDELRRKRFDEELRQLREEADHRLKVERERMKDFYEERSYKRKDNSEALKYLPHVIAAIASGIAIFKSFKSS